MVERYLSEVSLEPIRILGGFDIKGGDIYLPRDLLEPDESLQKQIFPEADEWLKKVRKTGEVGFITRVIARLYA